MEESQTVSSTEDLKMKMKNWERLRGWEMKKATSRPEEVTLSPESQTGEGNFLGNHGQ